jgi:hypothetical protein
MKGLKFFLSSFLQTALVIASKTFEGSRGSNSSYTLVVSSELCDLLTHIIKDLHGEAPMIPIAITILHCKVNPPS